VVALAEVGDCRLADAAALPPCSDPVVNDFTPIKGSA
jgi:hypothetical protein